MKTFSTSGTGIGQTLSEIESDKIPIYDSMADAEADLANLSEGQIVATNDTGDELAQPVNVVEEDNMHAVSSDAVFETTKKISTWSNNDDVLTCEKIGQVVTLRINWENTNSSQTNPKNLGEIPEKYRPNISVRTISIKNNTDEPYGQVTIATNGNVNLYRPNGGTIPTGLYVGHATYVTSN